MNVLFFFKQKTAYEMLRSLVGSEMCIRDSPLHHDLDAYLSLVAEWGLGEIDKKPDPKDYGVTP